MLPSDIQIRVPKGTGMTRKETDTISDQQYQALVNQAEDRTRGLRDLEDRSLATAVALSLGDRFFLATAGHVAEKSHRLALITETGELPLAVVNRGWRYNGEIDVAFVEVAREQAGAITASVGPEGILTDLDQKRQHNVLVLGFPTDSYVRIPQGIGGMPFLCRTVTIPRAEWPRTWLLENGQAIRLNAKRDIVVRYVDPHGEAVIRNRNTAVEVKNFRTPPPRPLGMSGCGMWLMCASEPKKSGLWRPNMQLIGLQHAAMIQGRLLRGTRIVHWLDLVAQSYPELAEHIKVAKRRARSFWKKAVQVRNQK